MSMAGAAEYVHFLAIAPISTASMEPDVWKVGSNMKMPFWYCIAFFLLGFRVRPLNLGRRVISIFAELVTSICI